jgi:serine/threonine-protein kinase
MEVGGNVNSDKPVGQVVTVIPNEGSTVKENATIKVILSSGQKKAIVPDLFNVDVAIAEARLKSSNLKMGNTTGRKNSDDIPKDYIIEQNPAKGTEVLEGSEVDIILSDGPELKVVAVPVIVGDTPEEARRKLEALGLKLGVITIGTDSKYIDGVIISQGVQSGTQVKQGSPVNVTVNKIETETTVTPTPNP